MTRVSATASFKTLWKSGLFWSRNPPRTDNESSKISKLRVLFVDIVPCGPCVAVFLPILAWVSSIHCSNIYLILVSKETASAMVCTSPGTPFRCYPNIVESRWRTSRNLQGEVVGVISLTAPAAVSVTNTVFPSTHIQRLLAARTKQQRTIFWHSLAGSCKLRYFSVYTPSSDKTQITREPWLVNTTSPWFITPILWTVWQSGELFFAIMTPSEVVRFSSFIPPSLLESEMYKSVPVKASP